VHRVLIDYWLYHGAHPIYCVRAPAGATDDDVRAEALRQHGLMPLRDLDHAPLDFIAMLRAASVHKD
jgi:hypothetical protein